MWTQEDKDCAKLLSESGMTAREVGVETGIPSGTIVGWRKGWGISTKNNYKGLYKGTVEEVQARLIKIMQEAPIVSYMAFNSKDSGTPAATTYRKYFGSWENALTAAGVSNSCSLKSDRATIVYLVEFDGFYKVGITQQTVAQRLQAHPQYTIVMQIQGTLEEAKRIEAQWLDNIKHLKYIPTTFPAEGRGFTECFKV